MACRGCWLPNVLSAPSSAPAGAQTSLSQGDLKTSGCPRAALSLPSFSSRVRPVWPLRGPDSAVPSLPAYEMFPFIPVAASGSFCGQELCARQNSHLLGGCRGHFPGVSGPGVHRSFPGRLERSCPPEGREGGWGEASPCHSVDKLRVNKGPGMGTGV